MIILMDGLYRDIEVGNTRYEGVSRDTWGCYLKLFRQAFEQGLGAPQLFQTGWAIQVDEQQSRISPTAGTKQYESVRFCGRIVRRQQMTNEHVVLLDWGSGAVYQTLWIYKDNNTVFKITQDWGGGEKETVHLHLDELEEIVEAARKHTLSSL